MSSKRGSGRGTNGSPGGNALGCGWVISRAVKSFVPFEPTYATSKTLFSPSCRSMLKFQCCMSPVRRSRWIASAESGSGNGKNDGNGLLNVNGKPGSEKKMLLSKKGELKSSASAGASGDWS